MNLEGVNIKVVVIQTSEVKSILITPNFRNK